MRRYFEVLRGATVVLFYALLGKLRMETVEYTPKGEAGPRPDAEPIRDPKDVAADVRRYVPELLSALNAEKPSGFDITVAVALLGSVLDDAAKVGESLQDAVLAEFVEGA